MIRIVIIKLVFDWVYHYLSGVYPAIMMSVNWSIAYNFIDYMFLSAVLLHIFFLIDSDKLKWNWLLKIKNLSKFFFFMGSMSYWLIAWMEMWFINSSLEEYQAGLLVGGIYWTHIASAIVGLITFMATYEFRRLYSMYRYI